MGRYSNNPNPNEKGLPPWVCAVCGVVESKACAHKHTEFYSLIRQNEFRSKEKLFKDSVKKFIRRG